MARWWLSTLLCLAGCSPAADEPNSEPYAAETAATGWGEDEQPDPAAACIVDGELQRPLWIADRSTDQLVLYEPGAAPLELPMPELGSWAYVDVSATHIVVSSFDSSEATVRLFTRAGELAWERRFADAVVGGVFLAEQGQVLAGYAEQSMPGTSFDGGLLFSDTETIELPWSRPAQPLNADGWAPALFLEPFDTTSDTPLTGWGWIEPRSGAKIILEDQFKFAPDHLLIRDDAFEYVDQGPDGPRLLHAGFDGSRWIPLPSPGARVIAFNDRYRLIDLHWSDDDHSLARASIADGDLYEFDYPPPPPGFEFFGCNGPSFSVDSLGRLLTGVRDDDAVWIAAWQPETDEWSLLGLPFADIGAMWAYALGGDIVYAIGSADECNDPVAPFVNPPADALLGESTQVVAVESGLAWPAGYQLAIDEQRVCATWVLGSERVVHDLEDGDQLVVPNGPAGWLAE